jgi:hypothetical protein
MMPTLGAPPEDVKRRSPTADAIMNEPPGEPGERLGL